jgi:hypothetical protein
MPPVLQNAGTVVLEGCQFNAALINTVRQLSQTLNGTTNTHTALNSLVIGSDVFMG